LENARGPEIESDDLSNSSEDAVETPEFDITESLPGYPTTTATFEQVLPGVDAELTPLRDGIKEVFVLHSPSSTRDLEFDIDLQGLMARLTELGEVEYLDADGEVVAVTPMAFMEDSASEGSGMGRVEYQLSQSDAGTTLTMDLDDEWLDDPDRQWPVRVDPSLVQLTAWNDDTFALQGWPANWSQHPELRTGTDTGGTYRYRSFMHFSTAALSGKVIDSAVLSLWGVHSPSCTERRVDLLRVTESWTGSTLTSWTAQPNAAYVTHELVPGLGQTGCNPNGAWVTFDGLEPVVQKWADGAWTNRGLSLRSFNEDNNSFHRRFVSASAGAVPPHLLVLWSDPPTPAVVADVSAAAIDAQPDPDGSTGEPDATVQLGDGSVEIDLGDGSTATLPSSAAGSFTLPDASGGQVGLELPDLGGNGTPTIDAASGLVTYDTQAGAVDVSIEPSGEGLQTMLVLNGPGAASDYSFPLDLPQGAVVEPTADGGAEIVSYATGDAEDFVDLMSQASDAASSTPPSDPPPPEDEPEDHVDGALAAVDDLEQAGDLSPAQAADLEAALLQFEVEMASASTPAEEIDAAVSTMATAADVLDLPLSSFDLSGLGLPVTEPSPVGATEEDVVNELATQGVVLGEIAAPWAVDANGDPVPVTQSVTSASIEVSVDLTGVTYPVVFDPRYRTLRCNSFSDYRDATSYIERTAARWCPRSWLEFGVWSQATGRNYMPKQSRIDGRNRMLAVRRSGECGIIPDTGPSWDFQVPCKGHDYCYDLIRWGLPRVRQSACDNVFERTLYSHCDHWDGFWDAVHRRYCRYLAAGAMVAVRLNTRVNPLDVSNIPSSWPNNH